MAPLFFFARGIFFFALAVLFPKIRTLVWLISSRKEEEHKIERHFFGFRVAGRIGQLEREG